MDRTLRTFELAFPGGLLQRGFWLYVWEITTPQDREFYYVGRTGDSSSPNAQSPFHRMGQHLGFNARSNVLRRRLTQDLRVDPDTCSFRLIAAGPILAETSLPEQHWSIRDQIAAMEKALADALREAGYDVLNTVHCRTPVDTESFVRVRSAFAPHFPALLDCNARVEAAL